MPTDVYGNRLPGATPQAAKFFDDAVIAFNLYRGDPVALLDRAIEVAPDFAMARIMKAHLYALATEPEAAAEARAILDDARRLRLDEREASHVAALDDTLSGNWSDAALKLDRHNSEYPHDMLALQAGHLIDFYRGNARNLRDRIARVLPRWSSDMPGHSILLGMYAFGLEECGDHARAEDMGRQATGMQPLDAWAHHAVAHVLEMQGRAAEGVQWIKGREPHWAGDDSFFQIHNWWHRALCHLELGEPAEALALYDGPIRGDRSSLALDLVDASALLWRLALSNVDLGDRWMELSHAWEQHADARLYPFNDWHAAMAHLGAGREHLVEAILASYRAAAIGPETSRWARDTGMALIDGFAAFHKGDYATAVEKLHGARFIANTFGGSHAQRDVIDWTLNEAAVRGRLRDFAVALAQERLALRPHSPVNRSFLNRATAE
jgi:tetratricopeptide (TPR) repeat protein